VLTPRSLFLERNRGDWRDPGNRGEPNLFIDRHQSLDSGSEALQLLLYGFWIYNIRHVAPWSFEMLPTNTLGGVKQR
jgi:hypothetical protein